MKKLLLASVATLALQTIGGAQASVVEFSGSPATSWADGTFSHNLSGDFADGFYKYSNAQTAYDGYGQNGEYILFNRAVTLNSLQILPPDCCAGGPPSSVTVSLYNGATLLSSALDSTPLTPVTETFNEADVTEVLFTFAGGTNTYGDGRIAAWYEISNVTYNDPMVSAVPEPASMALLGAGILGVGIIRRHRAA